MITSKQLEQQQQQPKRLAMRQRQRQQPTKQLAKRRQQRQQLVLELVQVLEQLLEQLLELEQQELLLFWSKQPEQQPAGKRSAGIFSWVFLKIQN
jgi:hypothetical protein